MHGMRQDDAQVDALLGDSAIVVEHVAKRYHGLAAQLLVAPTPLLTRAFKGRRPEGLDDPEDADEDGDDVEPDEEDEAAEIPSAGSTKPLWALRDVSFRAAPGEAIALVGGHGSGKTTLLKILAGAALPSSGSAVLRSRPSPLVAHAVQFVLPTYSPRRNAAFVGAFAGVSRRRLRPKLPAIFEFAGIGAREQRGPATTKPLELTLGVILHMDTDVLLLDDPFAVLGPASSERCLERIKQRRDEGATIVLETADRSAMFELCTRALWLDEGRIVRDGPVGEVLDAFDEAAARARAAGPAATDSETLHGFNETAAIAGVAGETDGDSVRVIVEVELVRPGVPFVLGAGLATAAGHGFWFEQPRPVESTHAGLHRFELVASNLPEGQYEGRVQVTLPRDEGDATIGRDRAFAVAVGASHEETPAVPDDVTWEPRSGAWQPLD